MVATSEFFLLFLITSIAAFSSSSSVCQQSTDFIRTSCNSTSYPDLCFSSLSEYTCSVQGSPLKLARIATKLSLNSVKSAASKASSVYRKSVISSTNSSALKALKDCSELLRDAMDNTKFSLSELKKMDGTKTSVWRLANVQTYMSAVLTKEDTCTDGMKEMGAVVKQVSERVGRAEQFTSNALGLVNKLRKQLIH